MELAPLDHVDDQRIAPPRACDADPQIGLVLRVPERFGAVLEERRVPELHVQTAAIAAMEIVAIQGSAIRP
jgi:hypothetical protein